MRPAAASGHMRHCLSYPGGMEHPADEESGRAGVTSPPEPHPYPTAATQESGNCSCL